MSEHHKGDLTVGTRVQMKATDRIGTIRHVFEEDDRKAYGVVYDRTPQEEPGPLLIVGERSDEFGIYVSADAFDVLPS